MKIVLVLFLMALSACSSKPKEIEPARARPIILEQTGVDSDNQVLNIDYIGLQKELGLEFAANNLGYREKSFNTCEAGYGYSPTKNCRKAFFSVLIFQLMCRDTEDTVSSVVLESQMFPLSNRKVRWVFKDQQGLIDLDNLGFGQIMTVMSQSSVAQRMKLAVDNDFLYMRASEIKRIVTPRNWCNR